MNDETGFITLHRKIMESECYKTANSFMVAVTLLLLANHTEKKWNGIVIPRGSFVTGRKSLSKLTHISESSVYRNLKKLEASGFCNITSNNEFSIILIVKYDQYQIPPNNDRTGVGQQIPSKSLKSNTKSNNENTPLLSTEKTTSDGGANNLMNNDRTTTEQRPNTTNTLNTLNKKNSLVAYELIDKELTELLFKLVKENYPFVKRPPSETDYADMNRLRRLDERTPEQIRGIIIWSQKDDFWKQNVRSVKALRKQFDSLLVKAYSGYKKNNIMEV